MLYEYLPSFLRDVKKASKEAQIDLKDIISEIKTVNAVSSISNLKKLKGAVQTYRIKCQSYRVCFYYENETIFLARFLPRKNVYKYFP
jgi:mRNA interferase RelE/StbE